MRSGTYVRRIDWENRLLKPTIAGRAEHVHTDTYRWVEEVVVVCGHAVLVTSTFLVVSLPYT